MSQQIDTQRISKKIFIKKTFSQREKGRLNTNGQAWAGVIVTRHRVSTWTGMWTGNVDAYYALVHSVHTGHPRLVQTPPHWTHVDTHLLPRTPTKLDSHTTCRVRPHACYMGAHVVAHGLPRFKHLDVHTMLNAEPRVVASWTSTNVRWNSTL